MYSVDQCNKQTYDAISTFSLLEHAQLLLTRAGENQPIWTDFDCSIRSSEWNDYAHQVQEVDRGQRRSAKRASWTALWWILIRHFGVEKSWCWPFVHDRLFICKLRTIFLIVYYYFLLIGHAECQSAFNQHDAICESLWCFTFVLYKLRGMLHTCPNQSHRTSILGHSGLHWSVKLGRSHWTVFSAATTQCTNTEGAVMTEKWEFILFSPVKLSSDQ